MEIYNVEIALKYHLGELTPSEEKQINDARDLDESIESLYSNILDLLIQNQYSKVKVRRVLNDSLSNYEKL